MLKSGNTRQGKRDAGNRHLGEWRDELAITFQENHTSIRELLERYGGELEKSLHAASIDDIGNFLFDLTRQNPTLGKAIAEHYSALWTATQFGEKMAHNNSTQFGIFFTGLTTASRECARSVAATHENLWKAPNYRMILKSEALAAFGNFYRAIAKTHLEVARGILEGNRDAIGQKIAGQTLEDLGNFLAYVGGESPEASVSFVQVFKDDLARKISAASIFDHLTLFSELAWTAGEAIRSLFETLPEVFHAKTIQTPLRDLGLFLMKLLDIPFSDANLASYFTSQENSAIQVHLKVTPLTQVWSFLSGLSANEKGTKLAEFIVSTHRETISQRLASSSPKEVWDFLYEGIYSPDLIFHVITQFQDLLTKMAKKTPAPVFASILLSLSRARNETYTTEICEHLHAPLTAMKAARPSEEWSKFLNSIGKEFPQLKSYLEDF